MQHNALAIKTDGMACVCAALVTDNNIILVGKIIDKLAFAFVTKLGANENGCRLGREREWF